MTTFIKAFAIITLLTISIPAYADQAATPAATPDKPAAGGMMMCPMMGGMGQMQKNMSSMMQDMEKMQKDMKDTAMKERMQKMRDRMGSMMTDMKTMDGMGMMGGASPKSDGTQAPAPAPAGMSPQEHKAHHPEGG